MAKTWDTEMQERFDRLEIKVETIEKKVVSIEQKVASIEMKVVSIEKKVEALSTKSDMQFEKLQQAIQTLCERRDEGLKGISRQISDIGRSWDAKWSTHEISPS